MKNFKQNEYNPVHFERAFDLMLDMVYGEGGDGTGTIFCRFTDFSVVADNFAVFADSRGFNMKRNNSERVVTFSYDQTHISITSDEPYIHPYDDFIFIM